MREIMLALLAHTDLDVEAVVRWSGDKPDAQTRSAGVH